MTMARTKKSKLQSITNWLFVTTQLFALGWVTISYLIAAYSTIKLGIPFPVEELSKQAIETLFGVTALKVLGNIFEHNDGFIFGKSREREDVHEDL